MIRDQEYDLDNVKDKILKKFRKRERQSFEKYGHKLGLRTHKKK